MLWRTHYVIFRNDDEKASKYFKSLKQQIVVSPGNKTQKTLADVINDVSENPSLTQNFARTTSQNFAIDHEASGSMPSYPDEL